MTVGGGGHCVPDSSKGSQCSTSISVDSTLLVSSLMGMASSKIVEKSVSTLESKIVKVKPMQNTSKVKSENKIEQKKCVKRKICVPSNS